MAGPAGARWPDRLLLPWSDLRAPTVEVLAQAVLIGGACLVVELLRSADVPGRVLGVLLSAAVVAASILLAVAAGVAGDRRARRVAAAVGVYAATALLLRIAGDAATGGPAVLGASVAALGVVALLALSVAGSADQRRDRHLAVGVVASVLVGALVVVLAGVLAPSGMVAAADLVAWSGAGAAGVVLLLAGTALRRPLQRRAGLAFATLGAANAVRIIDATASRSVLSVGLEVGAVAMLLVAAVPFAVDAVRSATRQQDVTRRRLAEADAVLAGVAERDHELRTLVAGLSGAARALSDEGPAVDGRRLLVAAGGELERLEQLLDGAPAERTAAAVEPVLRGLALVHRAGGLDVTVDVDGDPHVAVEPGALAQVLTNLLVNCAQHAPGARVCLRARGTGDRVRVEVVDDGPGLPAGADASVLRRGVRGPGSTGAGLGLAISAELVERHHGTFTMVSGAGGCTAVLDLPRPGGGAAAA